MASKIVTSVIRLVFLFFIFLFLFYPDKFGITFDFVGAPLSDHVYVRLAKTVLWLLFLIELFRIFYYGIIKPKAKGTLANIFTIGFPLTVVLVLLEIVFMFVPQSHEGVLSKASQIWWYKYWNPINSQGYRDKEVDSVSSKIKVLVLGDSFAAGHGIESLTDRFSDILETKLGQDQYVVYNLGVSGSDTRDEAERIEKFPVKPDILIHQYFPNDIERVAREGGLTLTGATPYGDLKGPLNTLVKRFYLPNFIYWQLPHTSFSTFEEFVQTAYTDSTILAAHFRDLDRIKQVADSANAKMYTVFVPFLMQTEKSDEYTKPVAEYLKSQGVGVISISAEINSLEPKDKVVGKNDGHASGQVNHLMADKVYNHIISNK